MIIKIQTLDNIFPLVIKRSASVQELKDKICEVINLLFYNYIFSPSQFQQIDKD